jgi:hypothetical protein
MDWINRALVKFPLLFIGIGRGVASGFYLAPGLFILESHKESSFCPIYSRAGRGLWLLRFAVAVNGYHMIIFDVITTGAAISVVTAACLKNANVTVARTSPAAANAELAAAFR